jgi:hypothetical protein
MATLGKSEGYGFGKTGSRKKRFDAIKKALAVAAAVDVAFLAVRVARAQTSRPPASMVTDWSHRHIIFSRPASWVTSWKLQGEPRYWQQAIRRSGTDSAFLMESANTNYLAMVLAKSPAGNSDATKIRTSGHGGAASAVGPAVNVSSNSTGIGANRWAREALRECPLLPRPGTRCSRRNSPSMSARLRAAQTTSSCYQRIWQVRLAAKPASSRTTICIRAQELPFAEPRIPQSTGPITPTSMARERRLLAP